jgi:putative polyhydroxyalkanoate system protein
MADIHIRREHQLGMKGARKVAWQWAEQAEAEFDMACTYAEGSDTDEVQFSRSGVSGTLRVSGDCFELDAKLGFLLGAFKDRIEAEIVRNLDELLASPKPGRRKG